MKQPARRLGILIAVLVALVLTPSFVAHLFTVRGETYSGAWATKSIDNTALSHNTLCGQYSQSFIDQITALEAQAHANYATVDVPFDDASGYLNCTVKPNSPDVYRSMWANSIRAHGMHVYWRPNWNTWNGDFGQPKETYATTPAVPWETTAGLTAVISGADTYSYIGKTYQWILHHGSMFQDGDIFAPFGEAEFNGILERSPVAGAANNCQYPYCQFPTFAAFNQWLRDSMMAYRAAFQSLGFANIAVDRWSFAGDTYKYLEPATIDALSVYSLDHYVEDHTTMSTSLDTNYNAVHKPIFIEWGPVWEGGLQPATTDEINNIYTVFASKAYIVGVNYWQIAGNDNSAPERMIDRISMTFNQTGLTVQNWYGQGAPVTPTATSTTTPTAVSTPTPSPTPTSAPLPPSAALTVPQPG